MANALRKTRLTEDDYLVLEAEAAQKSEYVNGETYLMAGASARHNKIAGNLFARLHSAIRGTPCDAFISDMKLRIAQYRVFYYPDVMLTCEEEGNPLYREAPCLIAEVLSPGTAGIDEREKWLHYRDIPSLSYYLLVASDRRHARLFSRDAEGWLEETLGEDEVVNIQCGPVKTALSLDDLFERTDLSA
ncbi:MAG: Uma2 family endonuclease [Rhodocyclaceae bacterium]|nr:Uma2 family endonuclease [Rhodocyclaceae bacterium]